MNPSMNGHLDTELSTADSTAFIFLPEMCGVTPPVSEESTPTLSNTTHSASNVLSEFGESTLFPATSTFFFSPIKYAYPPLPAASASASNPWSTPASTPTPADLSITETPAASSVSPSQRALLPGGKFSTRACQRCRARKVKCDFEYPSCHRCARSGHECHYVRVPQVGTNEEDSELEGFMETFTQKISAMCERLQHLEENLRAARRTYLIDEWILPAGQLSAPSTFDFGGNTALSSTSLASVSDSPGPSPRGGPGTEKGWGAFETARVSPAGDGEEEEEEEEEEKEEVEGPFAKRARY
ncbi:uncharacterized protein VTP21DRAFT_1727 [Calcarisporiella thermophila]|uniref:uncharacterized protein n=1 Tax=Calcarisporiella thermophila TaxID=911321 RepID=UPI003742B8DE